MPRSHSCMLVAVAASMLAITLTGCDNSSTTYACEGIGACRLGLTSMPAPGEDVKLYLAGVLQPLYGKVNEVDDQRIDLVTRSGGRMVARWSQVLAWESGPSVREELSQAEMLQRLMDYRAANTDMISITSGKLPGADEK